MAVAKVQSNITAAQSGSLTSTCAFLSNTALANVLLVYIICQSQSKTFTVSDTLGNTWVSAGAQNLWAANGNSYATQCFYVKSSIAAGANTVSVVYGGAKVLTGLEIVEISGCDATNPLDQFADNAPAVGTSISSGQAFTSASITPTVNGELIWCGMGFISAGVAMNAGSGYTILNQNTGTPSYVDEFKLLAVAAPTTATLTASGGYTLGAGGTFGMSIASFKPPAAGGNWLKEGYLWQRATESSGVF